MVAIVGFDQPKKPYFFCEKMPSTERLRIHFYKTEKRVALKLHKLLNFDVVLDGWHTNRVDYEVLRKVFS